MRLLKSIAAVYVAIYLVLPGCLCQVLSAFGCDTHEDVAQSAELPFQLDSYSFAPFGVCHCDEVRTKNAELAEVEVRDLTLVGDFVSFPVDVPGIPSSDYSVSYNSRGPPGGSPWSRLPFSGVFRI